jgi:hypothetical protein
MGKPLCQRRGRGLPPMGCVWRAPVRWDRRSCRRDRPAKPALSPTSTRIRAPTVGNRLFGPPCRQCHRTPSQQPIHGEHEATDPGTPWRAQQAGQQSEVAPGIARAEESRSLGTRQSSGDDAWPLSIAPIPVSSFSVIAMCWRPPPPRGSSPSGAPTRIVRCDWETAAGRKGNRLPVRE